MKALSVRQPWAWALLHGKPIENRSRQDGSMPTMCRHRGPVLLHASSGCTRAEYMEALMWMHHLRLIESMPPPLHALPRGGIVGWGHVVAHVEPNGAVRARPDGESGTPAGLGPLDMRWHVPGSYGLVIVDRQPLPFVPWKGALGLFEIAKDDVESQVVRAYQAEPAKVGPLKALLAVLDTAA